MKVLRRYTYEEVERPIQNLIEDKLTEWDYDRGQLEEIEHTAKACAHAIAVVMAKLVERGLLQAKEIEEFIPYNYKLEA